MEEKASKVSILFAVYVLSGGPPPKHTKVANEAKAADSSFSTSESIE